MLLNLLTPEVHSPPPTPWFKPPSVLLVAGRARPPSLVELAW